MNARPILFSAPMVRAILEGRKTQTRRPVKGEALKWLAPAMFKPEFVADPENRLCPYGNPGGLLWVRETWAQPYRRTNTNSGVIYRADGPEYLSIAERKYGWGAEAQWRPSIHMPRRASRITLEITGVRVERLLDISEADAQAEGVQLLNAIGPDQRLSGDDRARTQLTHPFTIAFASLWDDVYADRGAGWSANPWVWIVEFRRLS